jgi:hypothetical protein
MQVRTRQIAGRTVLVAALAGALAVSVRAEEAPSKTVRAVSRTVTLIAEVQSIDLPNRIVVLRQDDRPPVTLKVDERARNLPQLRVGDAVKAEYLESLVVRLHKPGAAEPGASVVEGATRAALGEKPGGTITRQVTVVAPIVALDAPNLMVTLRGVDGNLVEHKVRDARLLEGVSVGDNVELAYLEAVAISVNPVTRTTNELNESELSRIRRSSATGK